MFRNKIFKNFTRKASVLFRKGIRGQEDNKQILIEDCRDLIYSIVDNYNNLDKQLEQMEEYELESLKEDLEIELEHSDNLLRF